MRLIAYIRVSSRGQVERDGPDRQRETIKEFCYKNSIEFVTEKFEAGVSGTKECLHRQAFSEMLDEIDCRRQNGETVDGIVVERMDRLARDLIVQELLLKECAERKIKVFSADCGELMDMASTDIDPTRKLIRQVLGAVAEYAKSELVLKLAKARARVKRQTGRCEGQLEYGAHPGEKDLLLFLNGIDNSNMTWKGKADMLNQAGFKTRLNTPWTRDSVKYLVKNVVRKRKVAV